MIIKYVIIKYCKLLSCITRGPQQCSFFKKAFFVKNLLLLESHNRILHNVVHADLTALLDDLGMLSHQQPANVGKEESAVGVVGISVSLRILVVNSMIASPLVNVILVKENLQLALKNSLAINKQIEKSTWKAIVWMKARKMRSGRRAL